MFFFFSLFYLMQKQLWIELINRRDDIFSPRLLKAHFQKDDRIPYSWIWNITDSA